METVEVRGMYKEELEIERGKYPTYNKVWWIHTDGSMIERDVEYACPPFLIVYRDAKSVFRDQQKKRFETPQPTPSLREPSREEGEGKKLNLYRPYG